MRPDDDAIERHAAWIAEHPDGVVLVRRRDLKKKRGPRPQLEKLAVVGKWIVMQTSEAAIRAGHLSPDGEPANP